MSVLNDNLTIIITGATGFVGTVFSFVVGKKSRDSNANIEIGKAYELMAKQNNDFILTMTKRIDLQSKKIDEQTQKIHHLEKEVTGLRKENKLLLAELKKYKA
jgi:hypothetical protein